MANAFQLSVVTPEKIVYEADVTSVVIPGVDGYLGVWAQHAPMVAAMRPGVLSIIDTVHEGRWLNYAIGGGFAEVSDNKLIVLADSAIPSGEIDVESVRKQLATKQARLRERHADASEDLKTLQADIDLALAQVRAVEHE